MKYVRCILLCLSQGRQVLVLNNKVVVFNSDTADLLHFDRRHTQNQFILIYSNLKASSKRARLIGQGVGSVGKPSVYKETEFWIPHHLSHIQDTSALDNSS